MSHNTVRSVRDAFKGSVKLLRQGQAEDALELLKTGLKIAVKDKDRGPLLYNIGVCHVRLGQHDMAIDALRKAIQAQPNLLKQIKKDKDFVPLLNMQDFKDLVSAAPDHDKFKAGRFMLIYSTVLITSLLIVYVGNQRDIRKVRVKLGEGFFNLAVNDVVQIVFDEENNVAFPVAVDGNDVIKDSIEKFRETGDMFYAKKIKELEDLNKKARWQGAIILLLFSLVATLVFYCIRYPEILDKIRSTLRPTPIGGSQN